MTAVDAPITNIRAIVTDNAGNCWFGTYGGGLARLRDGQFTLLTTRDGLPNNNLEALFVDRTGDLWVGTWGGGISRYRDGQFTTWTMKEGLASNHIYAFYEDFTGALWIGTGGGGLSRFKDGKFSNVTIKDGLYDNLTYCLLSDKSDESGDLWMNSNKGVFRASLRDLNEFCNGQRASVSSTAYGIADGMLNRGGNRAQTAGWKTRAGNLLFATLKGLVIIDPQKRNLQPPLVKIEGVKLAGQSFPSDSVLQLKPGQGNLEIQYTGLSWRRPQQIGFKYQMVGLDQDWVEAGTRRTAYYPHLPPGEYTFRVIADNGDGVWNTTGQSMRIVVLPPFYQTWWFRMLTALAAVGLITLAWKIRVRQLEAKRAAQQAFSQQLIESQEAERKRIAGELHDSLGQNLIVIKNWATLGMAVTEPDAPVREQLDEISTTALQALNDVRSIIHTLPRASFF